MTKTELKKALAAMKKLEDAKAELLALASLMKKDNRWPEAGSFQHFAHLIDQALETDEGQAGLRPWLAREAHVLGL